MAYPKIVYGVGPTTLNFTYPPVQKSGTFDREAIRYDTFTTTRIRQSILEAVDIKLTLTIEVVPFSDLPAWDLFMDFAIRGGQFAYYPDSALSTFNTYDMEDTTYKPKLNVRSFDKFSFTIRQVPGGAFAP